MFNTKVKKENKTLNRQNSLLTENIQQCKEENNSLRYVVEDLKEVIKELNKTIEIQDKILKEIEIETKINQLNSVENYNNKIKAILVKLPTKTNIATQM